MFGLEKIKGLEQQLAALDAWATEVDNKALEVEKWMAAIDEELEAIEKSHQDFENRLNKLKHDTTQANQAFVQRLEVLEAYLKDYLEVQKRRESEEPFIEVISELFDEKNGLQIKLDWNPAMINYLKRNGYRGETDDDIVQKYVSDLFNDRRIDNAPEAIT